MMKQQEEYPSPTEEDVRSPWLFGFNDLAENS